jgi:mono/diheme cytochrome c family protein
MPARDRVVVRSLTLTVLCLVLIVLPSCNPNPQPEGLTPIPSLAPAATLIPALEEAPVPGGEAHPSPEPAGGDPGQGAVVFQNCAGCHGENATGGIGPSLVSAEMKAKGDAYYRQVITNGVTGTAMPAWGGRLSDQDIEDVIAFLRSLQ